MEQRRFQLPEVPFGKPYFSPTGRILAMVEVTKTFDAFILRLWDTLSGQQVRQIDLPYGGARDVVFAPDGRTLVTACYDSTILLWDLTGHLKNGVVEGEPLTAQQLALLWAELKSDGPRAEQAIWTLALAPVDSLRFLKECLQSPEPAKMEHIAKLVDALASDRVVERETATQILYDLGEAAEGELRKVLDGHTGLEARKRIGHILENRDQDVVRKLRAIEVIEQIGTSEAREVLEALRKNTANSRLSVGAAAALERLAKRSQLVEKK